MAVDAPRCEDAFSETVLTGTTDVIHDLVTAIFDDGVANACGDRVEGFVPGGALPISFAAFAVAFEWIQDAVGIGYLVESCRAFGAVASARTGMFGIPLKLLHLAGDLIDVSEQPARRLAVEAGRRHKRVISFNSSRPRS